MDLEFQLKATKELLAPWAVSGNNMWSSLWMCSISSQQLTFHTVQHLLFNALAKQNKIQTKNLGWLPYYKELIRVRRYVNHEILCSDVFSKNENQQENVRYIRDRIKWLRERYVLRIFTSILPYNIAQNRYTIIKLSDVQIALFYLIE